MAMFSGTDLILNADGSVYHLGLVPSQLADTIIAVGDPDRVGEVSKYFDNVEFKNQKREFVTHTGEWNGRRLSVMSTGIGTDNVEIFFNEVDALVNVDLNKREVLPDHRSLNIIRVGTSGSMQKDLPVDSLVVNDYAAGLDNLMQFYQLRQTATESSLAAGLQMHTRISFLPFVVQGSTVLRNKLVKGMTIGNAVTCPGFYAPQGRKVRVPVQYPQLLDDLGSFNSEGFRFTNFEMETSGYFALGRLFGHHAASVNAIMANRVTGEFSKRPSEVIDSLIRIVLEKLA